MSYENTEFVLYGAILFEKKKLCLLDLWLKNLLKLVSINRFISVRFIEVCVNIETFLTSTYSNRSIYLLCLFLYLPTIWY